MKVIAWFMALISTISIVAVTIATISFWYGYQSNAGDYLKLAGDAPSLEKASEFLGNAISYMEKEGLTQGNSSYIFDVPTNDVGIWYQQIKGAYDTTVDLLRRINEDSAAVTQLERDNALMKIREVLLDDSSEGTTVTEPENIMWFPKQWGVLIWWILSIIFVIIGWFMVYITWDD